MSHRSTPQAQDCGVGSATLQMKLPLNGKVNGNLIEFYIASSFFPNLIPFSLNRNTISGGENVNRDGKEKRNGPVTPSIAKFRFRRT